MPQGHNLYNQNLDKCLLLKKATYGLSQSARQWWKKFVKTMKGFWFKLSQTESCLLFQRNDHKISIIIVYVDDCLIIGHQEEIEKMISKIKSIFKIKEKGTLEDYLGCKIIFNKLKSKAWIGQPHLMRKLEENFGEEVKKLIIVLV